VPGKTWFFKFILTISKNMSSSSLNQLSRAPINASLFCNNRKPNFVFDWSNNWPRTRFIGYANYRNTCSIQVITFPSLHNISMLIINLHYIPMSHFKTGCHYCLLFPPSSGHIKIAIVSHSIPSNSLAPTIFSLTL